MNNENDNSFENYLIAGASLVIIALTIWLTTILPKNMAIALIIIVFSATVFGVIKILK